MIDLIRKDLIRRWRSPLPTLAMLVFPLFMTSMLGLLIGNSGGQSFPAIKVLIQDEDGGFVSELLTGFLGQEEAQEYLLTEIITEGGRERMAEGEASALVIFPEGFSDEILNGRPATIELVRNPAEGIGPEIIEQGTNALATYLNMLSRILGDELLELQSLLEAEQLPPAARVGALTGAMYEKVSAAERYLFPLLVTVGSEKLAEEDDGPGFNIFSYLLIMTTVMALLFVASRSVNDLFEEQKSGMLTRQLATPVGIASIVGAKLLFSVVFGLIVFGLLGVIGLALGWLDLPINVLGSALLASSFSLAASGLLALVFALVRTEKQAGVLGWLVIMGMSALGGSMIPVEQMPAAMRGAANYTINFWVIDGFKELLFGGAGLGDVLEHVGVLTAFGVVTIFIGHQIMVRRFREVAG